MVVSENHIFGIQVLFHFIKIKVKYICNIKIYILDSKEELLAVGILRHGNCLPQTIIIINLVEIKWCDTHLDLAK